MIVNKTFIIYNINENEWQKKEVEYKWILYFSSTVEDKWIIYKTIAHYLLTAASAHPLEAIGGNWTALYWVCHSVV